MLGLLNKKTDHPMADIKSTQMLLLDLPKNDALKSLQEVSAWMESAREQEEFHLEHQFEVLRMLDETARYYERKLAREYYAPAALPSAQENRLWMALNEFSTQALLAYLKLQVRYRNGDKGAAAVKSMMPLVAARGISAAKGMLKSAAARHAFFDQEIWTSLAEFYVHAEEENYLDEPVALYGGSGDKTSARSELAAALMWYASSSGTLGRLHMHLAERVVGHFGGSFAVSAQREPGSLFGFDLDFPMSPMRLGAEAVPSPSLRFIGVGGFQQQIDGLLDALEKNAIPDELNLGGSYDVEDLRIAVRHLAKYLKSPAPARRNVRHNVKISLSVAGGLHDVMEQVGMGLNFSGNDNPTWQVEDISISGVRCVLPASAGKGVEIGQLVGIKPENVERWGVGIVRRLGRDPQRNLHVGMEMLSNHASGVGLREGRVDEELHALWLDNPGGNAGEVSLLMSPGNFSSNSLHTEVDGRKYLLMPLKVVERGADFDLVRYRKIEEDND